MNHWLDRIQTCCGGSLDIFDDRSPFWKNPYKMADGRHFEKNSNTKSLRVQYLMNRWLDHIQILCSGSLGISNVLLNIWE